MENEKAANEAVTQQDKDIKSKLAFDRSFGDQIALKITNAFGNIKFLTICVIIFIVWVAWNLGFINFLKPFDPYPFAMLTMIVSLFAIILSIAVLISQNREGKMDSIRQQIEFEVNVQAENEITKVLEMLHEIQKKMGIDIQNDKVLEEMKENLDIQKLHEKLTDTDEDEKFNL